MRLVIVSNCLKFDVDFRNEAKKRKKCFVF